VGEAMQHWRTLLAKPGFLTLRLRGAAMEPTLNMGGGGATELGDRLLLRPLPHPDPSTVFVGDVVAFSTERSSSVLVRRVVAGAGDEMMSSQAGEEDFRLPSGTCWLAADNLRLPLQSAVDSRQVGPVAYSSILGRVLYFSSSKMHHGDLLNSLEAMRMDAEFLEAELDVDTFCKQIMAEDTQPNSCSIDPNETLAE